jgi:general secretion pathway protein B
MSYILDALKKSEQERGSGSVPGVQTVHSSSLSYRQEKSPVWPWFIAALISMNLIAIAYFVLANNKQVDIATAQPEASSIPVTSEAPIIKTPQITPALEPVAATSPMQTQTYETEAIVQTETIEPIFETVDFYDLPLNVRQYVPAMEFSAHVYSSNPQQRSIVINGRFMEEGSFVNNELLLSEITSDGAVFDFQGHRFSTSVLASWN